MMSRGLFKYISYCRNVVTNTITWLKSIYREMHGYREKKHGYLGIWLYLSLQWEVKVTTEDYLEKLIDKLPKEIKGMSSTPVTENLFKVQDDYTRKMLNGTQKIGFNHTVAHILFTEARFCKDIQTSIAFLTNRLIEPKKTIGES